MKQLTDSDIAKMINEQFVPDEAETKKSVRAQLHLSKLIPQNLEQKQDHITLDFHNHTEEEAWQLLQQAVASKAKTATVITGASGILKIKFQQWIADSVLSKYIISFEPINNGSFNVKLRHKKI
jgi:DNA-nicking Smr family endonuclease